MAEGRLPVDGELLQALRALMEQTNAGFVSVGFDVPDTDLELVVTLRFKEEDEG